MSLYLSPRSHRLLGFGYWAMWLNAAGVSALSLLLDSGDATLLLFALSLMLVAVGCWLFLPLPYPGSIAKAVTMETADPQTILLPQAFSNWARIDILQKAQGAGLIAGRRPIAEVTSQPGNDRVMLELGIADTRNGVEKMSTIEFTNHTTSAIVKVMAEGEWLIRAGEESHPWKEARVGWIIAQKARAFICWSGALICVILLVRCYYIS